MPKNNYEKKLSTYLAKHGLKLTNQRKLIANEFFKTHDHLSAEELYQKIRNIDPSIGQATVYRTLKLMRDANLAHELHFGGDVTRFEPYDAKHHDHLICNICSKTIPVFDEQIELLQTKLAAAHNFRLETHCMHLYGICADCSKKNT